eukprot:CAMPEP_0181252632 /NCGR_PEP_ID=MMETSP1096-20121128/47574_1 /TAXON_ID=156174 ORGANISM="Chrysochromulina ericina, Strain CCMP281" /NCGR_SAMPLE_ID=MMETSP1096 /ASSEMBLY_ACC=CAM_ASM_000453 /LENGTH=228 /DNA_ID=CAMNT_0023350415 /DNA_START=1044 /DNA_END=1733 /DNA_ORIENTATION=+
MKDLLIVVKALPLGLAPIEVSILSAQLSFQQLCSRSKLRPELRVVFSIPPCLRLLLVFIDHIEIKLVPALLQAAARAALREARAALREALSSSDVLRALVSAHAAPTSAAADGIDSLGAAAPWVAARRMGSEELADAPAEVLAVMAVPAVMAVVVAHLRASSSLTLCRFEQAPVMVGREAQLLPSLVFAHRETGGNDRRAVRVTKPDIGAVTCYHFGGTFFPLLTPPG